MVSMITVMSTTVAAASTTIALTFALRQVVLRDFQPSKADSTIITTLRWFSAPIAAIATAFSIACDPERLHTLPSLFARYGARLHQILPLHPKDLLEAFQLGEAHRALVHEGNVSAARKIAEAIAGRTVTDDEILRLPELIAAEVQQVGLVSRVLSVFSLVNVVWFIAIVGLTCTVGPFIYTVLKPFRSLLWQLWTAAWDAIVVVAKRLSPMGEMVLYAVAVAVLLESSRYAVVTQGGGGRMVDAYSMTGAMTGFTSIALFTLAWSHTTSKNSTGGGDFQTFMNISLSLVSLFCIPAAKIHQSELLGYCAATAAAASLGFSAYSNGLCTMIGFQSHEAVVRGAVGCGTLSLVSLALRGLRVESPWAAPIISPMTVIGTSVYLLALDIHSFTARNPPLAKVFYVSNLIAITTAGHLVGLVGMANVAKTFGGLFAFTVYCENVPKSHDAFIVWVFTLFAGLYGMSLYVSRNPELIVSLMSGGAVQ